MKQAKHESISIKFPVDEAVCVQARLRKVSHPIHVRLNHHPLLAGLTGQNYSLTAYRTILIAYFHLYEKLEMRIAEFVQSHAVSFDYSDRLKLPWLLDDLIFLNEDPLSHANVPAHFIEIPKIESVGQLIGMLYPIEGASLGGQVVSQHLINNFHFSISRGARFFNGYGDKTSEKWAEFCLFADSIQGSTKQCKDAEDAALFTFNKFEEVLNDYHQSAS